MQTNNLVLSQLPFDELVAAISNSVFAKLQSIVPAANNDAATPVSTVEKYLSRKTTAERLDITLPTLNKYTKKGIVTGYRVGARVLYKNSEIDGCLLKVQFACNDCLLHQNCKRWLLVVSLHR